MLPRTTPSEVILRARNVFANEVSKLMESFNEETGLHIIGIDFITHRRMGSPIDRSDIISVRVSGFDGVHSGG